jgi:hypothetical protein
LSGTSHDVPDNRSANRLGHDEAGAGRHGVNPRTGVRHRL